MLPDRIRKNIFLCESANLHLHIWLVFSCNFFCNRPEFVLNSKKVMVINFDSRMLISTLTRWNKSIDKLQKTFLWVIHNEILTSESRSPWLACKYTFFRFLNYENRKCVMRILNMLCEDLKPFMKSCYANSCCSGTCYAGTPCNP